MPETDFILCPDEQMKLIDAFLNQGVTFVPAMRYKTAHYVELTDAKDVQEAASSEDLAGPIFVLSPRFSVYPLELDSVEVEYCGEMRFFLTQRHGGPYLDMAPSRVNTTSSPPRLISGFIAYYASYYIDADFTEVPAPAELKALYRIGLGWLRKHGKRVYTDGAKRIYWVGLEAYSALRAGKFTTVQGLEV